MGEFDLIDRYFKTRFAPLLAPLAASYPYLTLGIGDDCALLPPAPGMQLALSTDTLVEGRHFLSTVPPRSLGHKALAVNLSDLAACGAQPLAFLLSLTLPRVDEPWLDAFSQGLLALATHHNCPLIGGNTSSGPLAIGITVLGQVPVVNGRHAALLRSGAQAGDGLWVSGQPGKARAALEIFRGNLAADSATFAALRERMECPSPRVALGQNLRGVATAAIDVSDGLLGDLGHVLRASGQSQALGAVLDESVLLNMESSIFIATNVINTWTNEQKQSNITQNQVLNLVLNGGDDYELLFTAPQHAHNAIVAAAAAAQTPVHCIGQISAQPGVFLQTSAGKIPCTGASFDHFA